jgi:hypothetical protein
MAFQDNQGFLKNLGLLAWKEQPRWNPCITGGSIDWKIVPATLKNLVAFETAAA